MSTHTHIIEIVYKSDGLPIRSDFSFQETDVNTFSSIDHTFDNMLSKYKYLDSAGCRETVNNIMRVLENPFLRGRTSSNSMMGIRIIGEQIHKTVEIMEKYPNSVEILQKFLSKILGIEFSMEIEDSNSKDFMGYFSGKKSIILSDGSVHSHKLINIFIPAWLNKDVDNFPQTITGLLWIIREPTIIEKIVGRKTRSVNTLARELISLSMKRIDRTDTSFCIYGVYGSTTKKKVKDLEDYWKEINVFALNSEASDFMSVFYASLFFFNKGRRVKMHMGGNGFVSMLRTYHLEDQLRFFKKTLEKGGKSISKGIDKIKKALLKSRSDYRNPPYPEYAIWEVWK